MAGDQERPCDGLNGALDERRGDEHEVARQPVGPDAGGDRDRRSGRLLGGDHEAERGRRVGDPEHRERERDRRDAVAERGDGRAREDEPEVALSERAEPALQLHAVREASPSTISDSNDVSASIAASRV